MTVFVMVAILLVVAALLFVLPPLIKGRRQDAEVDRNRLNISVYRDQLAELERDRQNDLISEVQFEEGRLELEGRLLADIPGEGGLDSGEGQARAGGRWPLVVIGGMIPVLAAVFYLWLGMPAALNPETQAAQGGDAMSDRIHQMVEALAQRLEDDPNDAEGWAMLGRSYIVLERFPDALKALERAVALNGQDPTILADLADAIAMTSGEALEGRPIELINRALRIDPNHQKSLWLAGTAAYERRDFEQAINYWQRLYRLVPANSEVARTMAANIAEIQTLLGRPVEPLPDPGSTPVSTDGRAIRGRVLVDRGLQSKIAPTDTVFVFARAVEGPSMPLAILRVTGADLPLDYTLDESMAMNEMMSLANFDEVVVVARVSKSGNAVPQSGDLQGRSDRIKPGASGIDILIDEVLP